MPKEYERGTYGQWMQQRLKNLESHIVNIQMNQDGDSKFWQEAAAATYSEISHMQRLMQDGKHDLNDKLPDKATMDRLYQYSAKQSNDPRLTEPFNSENLYQTMDLFGVDALEPPTMEEVLQNVADVQKDWPPFEMQEDQKQRQAEEERQRKEAYQKELLENAIKLKNQQDEERRQEEQRKREEEQRKQEEEQRKREEEQRRQEERDKVKASVDPQTAERVQRLIDQRETRKQKAKERAEQYPENSYGRKLQQLASELQETTLDLQASVKDTGTANEKMQKEAATTLLKMRLLQEKMNRGHMSLDDPMPPSHGTNDWAFLMDLEAAEQAEKSPNNGLFKPENIYKTSEYFNLDWAEPPTPENVLLPYGKMLGEKNKYVEAVREAKEKAKEAREARKAPAKGLLEELKATTQKSFAGKLKSWFVGNSKEYDAAYKALEDVSEGRGDPNKAKDAIKKYLDLRGNKIRDHQYGRDRFDAMLKGLALVSTTKEFMDTCEQIEDSRLARTNGKDVDRCKIDVTRYLSPDQSVEVEGMRRERQQQDVERLNKDADLHIRFYGVGFMENLKNLKNEKGYDAKLRQALRNDLVNHPGLRDAARDYVKKNGLKLDVPRSPDVSKGVTQEAREEMKKLDNFLRQELKLPQKQQERHESEFEIRGSQRYRGGEPGLQ